MRKALARIFDIPEDLLEVPNPFTIAREKREAECGVFLAYLDAAHEQWVIELREQVGYDIDIVNPEWEVFI